MSAPSASTARRTLSLLVDAMNSPWKLLLFDLDGTLLRSDKTISGATLQALQRCRSAGILIGISTARSEGNAQSFLRELRPEVLITSGGALVQLRGQHIYQSAFSAAETKCLIRIVREVCGPDCELTIDSPERHYWNYKVDPKTQDPSWGDSIYTDFTDFSEACLKLCVEIPDEQTVKKLQARLPQCDCARFSDGCWYKFTKCGTTKESAIRHLCRHCGFPPQAIMAFGDDYSDLGMLRMCGFGVAMGNAIAAVKEIADQVIGANDEDGIAAYLSEVVLS